MEELDIRDSKLCDKQAKVFEGREHNQIGILLKGLLKAESENSIAPQGVLLPPNMNLELHGPQSSGDLENVTLYTFPVANFALGMCQGHAGQSGGWAGEIGSSSSAIDFARSRVREPVLLDGPLKKKARCGAKCNKDDEDW